MRSVVLIWLCLEFSLCCHIIHFAQDTCISFAKMCKPLGLSQRAQGIIQALQLFPYFYSEDLLIRPILCFNKDLFQSSNRLSNHSSLGQGHPNLRIVTNFVNLKSNSALLYKKGHNLLTSAFPPKNKVNRAMSKH